MSLATLLATNLRIGQERFGACTHALANPHQSHFGETSVLVSWALESRLTSQVQNVALIGRKIAGFFSDGFSTDLEEVFTTEPAITAAGVPTRCYKQLTLSPFQTHSECRKRDRMTQRKRDLTLPGPVRSVDTRIHCRRFEVILVNAVRARATLCTPANLCVGGSCECV